MEKNIFDNKYIIYDDGRVWSNLRNRFLVTNATNSSGYKNVIFRNNPIQKTYMVHRLVAEAFIPNPDNLPQVNHKDGDKTNNRVENLEWVSVRKNAIHYLKSEFPGTHWDKKKNKFISQAWINGKHYYIGQYNTQKDAHRAYMDYILSHNLDSLNSIKKLVDGHLS